jgi:ubiquinone/menaquinone biosynthesis C-methylase UbiE
LDAGCGGGFYSLWLSEKGAKVRGIDGSEEMIKIAKEKTSGRGLETEFMVGNISHLKFDDDVFDLVLSTLVLMDISELDKVAGELVRVAKEGGAIVVSVQHPICTAGDWERKSGKKLFWRLGKYFTERKKETIWKNERMEQVSFEYYHRSLQSYTQPFLEKGCVLTHLVEPQPHKVYTEFNPREYEDTSRIPHFIILKFRKENHKQDGKVTESC